jgi:hypothetical protein
MTKLSDFSTIIQSANINSLEIVIQNEILLKYFNKRLYNELSDEEIKIFNDYFRKVILIIIV